MIYIVKYGIQFNLTRNRKVLTQEEALEVITNAANKVGIKSENIGCNYESKRLVPSANFMALSHLQSEFTAAVIMQDVKIKHIPKKRG
jgi:hypothetical protein